MYPIDPGPLLGQEAAGILVRPGAGLVDFLVRRVDVAAENDPVARGAQLLAFFQEDVVDGQFKGHAAMVASAIGKVAVEQSEGGVAGDVHYMPVSRGRQQGGGGIEAPFLNWPGLWLSAQM